MEVGKFQPNIYDVNLVNRHDDNSAINNLLAASSKSRSFSEFCPYKTPYNYHEGFHGPPGGGDGLVGGGGLDSL